MNEKLKQKYIGQFEDLIKEGKVVLSHRKSTIVIGADDYIPLEIFQPWRTRCVNLLNAVVPSNMLYYDRIKHYPSYKSGWTEANEIFGTLQGIYEDFKSDFLNSLALQVEGQIAIDYLQQASDLLCEKDNIQYSHVPAAVLTGVVLEKSIRVLCEKQNPPLVIIKENGEFKKTMPLIEDLVKLGVFSQPMGRKIQHWLDIRNSAAHGRDKDFKQDDVKDMIQGVNRFMADYLDNVREIAHI